MKHHALWVSLVFSAVQLCQASEFRSSIARVRLPDEWKQLPSGREDTLVFGPESGLQQLVVSLNLVTVKLSTREQATALISAMRNAIASYQHLYGEDIHLDDSFSASVGEHEASVFAIGYAEKSHIRVAIQINRRGDQQRTIAAYDASGRGEEVFRIWSTALIEGVR